MNRRPDIVIIGAGVMGCSAAYWLSKAGENVVVLDRRGLAAGASGMSAALVDSVDKGGKSVLPAEYSTSAARMFTSVAGALADESGVDVGFRQTPALLLAYTASDVERLRLSASECGPEVATLVTGEEARARQVGLASDVAAALAFQQSHVLARSFCRGLLRVAEAHGAVLRIEEAVEIAHDEGRVVGVRLRGGEMIRSRAAVVATGPWTVGLNAKFAFSSSVYPVAGQLLLLRDRMPPVSTAVHYERMYVAPKADGTIVAGATEEPHRGFDVAPTRTSRAKILAAVDRMIPGLGQSEVIRQLVGLRPASRDGVPLVGEVPEIGGLFLLTGHFRAGIKLSILSGQLVADMILGRKVPSYTSALSPGRRLVGT